MAKKLTQEQNARKQVWQVINRTKKMLEGDDRVLKVIANLDDIMKVIDTSKGEWAKQVQPLILVQVEQIKILSGKHKRKFGSERVWISGKEALGLRRALNRAQQKDIKLEEENPELAEKLKEEYGTFGQKRSIGSIIRQRGEEYDQKRLEKMASRSSWQKHKDRLEGFRKGLITSINNAIGKDREIAKDITAELRKATLEKLEEVYDALNADNNVSLAFVSNAYETGGLLGAAKDESRIRILMDALGMDIKKEYQDGKQLRTLDLRKKYTVVDIEER